MHLKCHAPKMQIKIRAALNQAMDKKRYVFPPLPEDTDFESYPYDDPFNIASATDFTGLVPFIGHDIPNRTEQDDDNEINTRHMS